jgi:hypothetical protein
MRSREWLLLGTMTLVAATLMAALPGGSVSAPGASTGDPCALPQRRFSAQVCNVPSPLASVSDEFDKAESASNWTIYSSIAAMSASSALDLYTTPTPNGLYSFSGYRAGWFFTQPIPNGAVEYVGMRRAYDAPSTLTAYLQFAALAAAGVSGVTVRIFLSTSATSPLNGLIGAGCSVRVASSGGNTVEAYSDVGSAASFALAGNLGRADTLVLHRNGTDFRCWMGNDDGRFVYGATVTKTVTATHLWVLFTSSSTLNSWASLAGINYLRVYEGDRVLP